MHPDLVQKVNAKSRRPASSTTAMGEDMANTPEISRHDVFDDDKRQKKASKERQKQIEKERRKTRTRASAGGGGAAGGVSVFGLGGGPLGQLSFS